jgi:hypothetical protein
MYRQLPADLEDLQQVIELSVNVSADGDRGPHVDEVGLSSQHFARLD